MSDVFEVILFLSSLCVIVGVPAWFVHRYIENDKAATTALELEMHRRFPKGSTTTLEGYGEVEIVELYPAISKVHVRIKDKSLVSLSWTALVELMEAP